MRLAKPILLAIGATVALLLAVDVVFAQCAMCRTALLNSPEGQKMANGFNSGILFLLSAPFLVVGMMVILIFKPYLGRAIQASRRASMPRSQQPAAAPGRSRLQ